MRRLALTTLSLGLLAVAAAPVHGQAMEMAPTEDVELTATVVDMSCKLVFDLSGDMHRECSQVCADRGVPLGLLASDGTFFLPVSQDMPGEGANELLRGHAEHQVTVRGKVVRKDGMNSIIIESVSM